MVSDLFDYESHFNAQGITDPDVINALAVLHKHWLAYHEKYPRVTMREYFNRLALLSPAAADRASEEGGE